MELKLILSITATLIAIVSYLPYIRNVRKGTTKPHVFSWFIWSLIAYIGGFAQLAGGGGVGSIVALTTATISLGITYSAFTDHAVKITKSDWVSFFMALSAIPIWLVTNDPLFAVVIITIVNLFAFWPTIRKSYEFPHQETLSMSVLSAIKHCVTIAALQKHSLVTALYPAALAITDFILIIELIVRRNHLPKKL